MVERRDFREGVQALIKSLDGITIALNSIDDHLARIDVNLDKLNREDKTLKKKPMEGSLKNER